MDEWPDVVGGQVGISAFAWTAGHLSSSFHPASTYAATRTFKGQVGLKVGRSGSQVQGMLQDLAQRALRVQCETRQVDTQSLLPRLVSQFCTMVQPSHSHMPPPTGHQPPQTHGPTVIGADSPIFTLSHIDIQVSLKSPYQTYSFNLNKLIQHHL